MSNQELDASSIDPSIEVEYLDVNSMKEEMYKLKQQMAEMYQAWAKGQPPPAYPTNPAFIPPLTQTQEHPTVDSPARFPIYHHYQGTTSQTPQAPPPKPVPYYPPPITPVFVASPSATLHQSSSKPVFQAQDNQYYPPEPTFKASEVYTPHFDLPAEAEKPSKNPEQEEMFRKVKSLEQSFRDMRELGGQVSVAYKDLCLFPNVQLLTGFNMPKFDLYDGHGDPIAHVRGFCSKMRGDGGKDELLMAYFSQSLSGSALEWYTRQDHGRWYTWDDLVQAFACHFQYNLEIVPDRPSLTKLEKKHSESFREYGFYWREQEARVYPPMKESEMVDYFLQALEPTYYGHLVSVIGKSLNEVVKMGGHDTEKCCHLKSAIQELIDTNRIDVQAPEAPNINQNPMPAHQEANMFEIVHEGGEPRKPSQTVIMILSSVVKTVEQSTSEKSALKSSERSSEPSVIVKKGSSSDVAAKQEKMKVVVLGVASKPVVIMEGARINHVIIKLGLTRTGRCFIPEELTKAKISKDNSVLVKKAVTEEEIEEFLRNMKVQDYSIMEQLRKAPAQISLLSLLIHSDEHRQALMKILNEAHVPDKITVNHLENIAKKIFDVNRVTFSDDELLVEGTEHNRALYLMVICENSVVTRVLVDNGSSANICPLSTLSNLKVEDERIHKNTICVWGFDGGGKVSVGDIMLELMIGLVEFTMEFQVLDIAVSYNLLLGRPWIHVAKAVPSTLHQVVKFEWDREEIIVMAKTVYALTAMPLYRSLKWKMTRDRGSTRFLTRFW
ncbi:uncharacterized protein [Nicotiana sylvestris]|uniref:uncharacterized protein n=1 Tax=Nicotiana sylvestris TaxID=4096 RepID=UPI00388CAFCA